MLWRIVLTIVGALLFVAVITCGANGDLPFIQK